MDMFNNRRREREEQVTTIGGMDDSNAGDTTGNSGIDLSKESFSDSLRDIANDTRKSIVDNVPQMDNQDAPSFADVANSRSNGEENHQSPILAPSNNQDGVHRDAPSFADVANSKRDSEDNKQKIDQDQISHNRQPDEYKQQQ